MSCVGALRKWMLECINIHDFEKAYRIRKILGATPKSDFYSECVFNASQEYFSAKLNYSEATLPEDLDEYSGVMLRAIARMDAVFKTLKGVDNVKKD